jgi:formylglycine-generating enzyme required for sulfatase activity
MPRSNLKLSREEWKSLIDTICHAGTDDFAQLAALSGLDPAKHLRFANWSGVNFADCDLRGFDFSGSRLINCDFTGALIEGARFDLAVMNGTNLKNARDWGQYLREWKLAVQGLPDDSHLPVEAIFQDAPFGPEMVVIPSGKFMMGSPEDEPERRKNEGPQREVTIFQEFAVGRYAVTFDEWDFSQSDSDWQEITGFIPRLPSDHKWGRGNRPVIDVSWGDAKAYVKWLSAKMDRNYRLLSEAEWEYCCRAGTDTPYWWGSSITSSHANYEVRPFEPGSGAGKWRNENQTVPVDMFTPNTWHLYQMHGNVWEWVEDVWHEGYERAPVDGSAVIVGDQFSHVVRGGAWHYFPKFLRSAYRSREYSHCRVSIGGFRVARNLRA